MNFDVPGGLIFGIYGCPKENKSDSAYHPKYLATIDEFGNS
jgi:hypothetical protein